MTLFRLNDAGSSFHDLLTSQYPNLFVNPLDPGTTLAEKQSMLQSVPHGTTILALRYRDGVVICGDRRATEGYTISERRIEKVYKTDETSAIAISGAAGACIELTRLFQVELEHYEKLEGTLLSMEGKANKLAQMIKANLPMAMQGLVVVPIYAGYDVKRKTGRIFKYDIAGGRYEERAYYATGSGGRDAKGTLKRLYQPDLKSDAATRIALEAIYDAAESDVATGGPDMLRGIFPNVKVIDKKGVKDVPDDTVKAVYEDMIAQLGGK
ncbi:MAG: proteasome subunit beta [Nitrospiria bacterium]